MSSKHGSGAALSLLVAGGLAALAGCTGGAADPPIHSSSPKAMRGGTNTVPRSPTPSTRMAASPTTTWVPIPKAARAHTEAGAEAFVRFFVDEVSIAWTIPGTGLIRDLGVPDCTACRSFESTALELFAAGHHYDRRRLTVLSAEAVVANGIGQRVHIVVQQHRVNLVDKQGKVVGTGEKERLIGDAQLVWEDGRWWVFSLA